VEDADNTSKRILKMHMAGNFGQIQPASLSFFFFSFWLLAFGFSLLAFWLFGFAVWPGGASVQHSCLGETATHHLHVADPMRCHGLGIGYRVKGVGYTSVRTL
jgi:hypothetical protein